MDWYSLGLVVNEILFYVHCSIVGTLLLLWDCLCSSVIVDTTWHGKHLNCLLLPIICDILIVFLDIFISVFNFIDFVCVIVNVRIKKESSMGKKDKILNCNIVADCVCSSSLR